MLMSMTRAPCASTIRAASAIGAASRPASCTADPSTPRPSSAFSNAPGRAFIISTLATISETTNPAPNDATRLRNGKSVIPAIGASKTGGSRENGRSDRPKRLILVQLPLVYRAPTLNSMKQVPKGAVKESACLIFNHFHQRLHPMLGLNRPDARIQGSSYVISA